MAAELHRLQFYSDRVDQHASGVRAAEGAVCARAVNLQSELFAQGVCTQIEKLVFLPDGVALVARCRRILQWSYVVGYVQVQVVLALMYICFTSSGTSPVSHFATCRLQRSLTVVSFVSGVLSNACSTCSSSNLKIRVCVCNPLSLSFLKVLYGADESAEGPV